MSFTCLAKPFLGCGFLVFTGLACAARVGSSGSRGATDWWTCRDEKHGFSLQVPPDWRSTTPEGTCVQFQKGESAAVDTGSVEVVPEVDVFIQVNPIEGEFPRGYLRDVSFPTEPGIPIARGVTYTKRQELESNGLPAVRAHFESFGPTLNWGIEYALRKGEQVLKIYISQPSPEIEQQFDEVVNTIRW